MFRWDDCLEGHILLGLIFSTLSLVCFILTTFSTPLIKGIYFLSVPISTKSSSSAVKFGSFGYCNRDTCSSTKVGYTQPDGVGEGNEIWNWMIKTHVLYGIASLLMLLAIVTLILSLLRVGKFMWNPVYFRTCSLLSTAFAIFAEAFALINWVHARHAFDGHGIEAKYGAALWVGLVGTMFAALRSVLHHAKQEWKIAVIGGPAYQGRFMYRAHSGVAYNV
nr:hypothetical protein L204_04758 [Cryptococcus depauperatus CBS 7855]